MYRWVTDVPRRIAGQISAMVEDLPLDSEEQTRLQHYLAFLLLGVPTMLAFGIYNCLRSNWVLGGVVFSMNLSLVLAWFLLKRLQSGVWLYRINSLFFGGTLLFLVVIGGDGGSKAMWLFTFPLVAFFLLSTVEGLVWTVAMFLAAGGLFWMPHLGFAKHAYSGEFTSRFMAVYFIVSVLACWFETLRQHYRKGMDAEHQRLLAERSALQEALSQVRQLSGLLHICASCKKVRDDQGYWTQIESYIRDRSEAEFSHSLCPDCGEELYPGMLGKSRKLL